jgi:predicted phosphodiesterase
MKIGKTQFIPENIAPPNAKNLTIFNGSKKVGTVDISQMQPSNLGNKLYSFGLVSDLHLDGVGLNGTYLSEAMTFFENQGCSFCCHAGDMTNIGFWYNNTDTEIYLVQMAEYKSVIDAHPNLPMYGICGNHESYNKSIMDNLPELKSYTYRDLYYTYTHGNDVFIFIGQPSGTPHAFGKKQEWINELKWLQETLERNRNKRCFVFEHLTLSDDSGNPNNIHNAFWGDLESTLVGIMKHYKNAMMFHGHSHLDFNEQFNWSYSNYSTRKGFKSISIPSSSGSRVTVNGQFPEPKVNDPNLRSGYIADVYSNCILLKGYYFRNFESVPIAQYCIDTALQGIEANTFTDSTGTINNI